MKRFWMTSVVLVGVALPGCKGGSSVDPIKLVPDAAAMIGGANFKALSNSKLYKMFEEEAKKQSQMGELEEAAKGCQLDPKTALDSITFGVDDAEHFVAVLEGKGIGVQANLDCIAGKAKEKAGKDVVTFAEAEGQKTMKFADEASITGLIYSDNMVVLTHNDWVAAINELKGGKGTAAVDASLKAVVGRADTKKAIWMAAQVPDAVRGEAPPQAEGVTDITASVDVAAGLAIAVSAGFVDAAKAKAAGDEAQKGFDQVKPMATAMLGIPAPVVESVKIEVADTALKLSASASDADLDVIATKVKEAAGGM